MLKKLPCKGSDLLAASLVICLAASWAFGQSGSRTETGAAPTDLQLSGPANNASPAPAAKMDIPPIDDALRDGPKTQDIDSFIAGDPPAILDPDPLRQGKAAPAGDLSPKPTLDETPAEDQGDTQQHVVAKAIGDAQSDVAQLQQRVADLEDVIIAQSELLTRLQAQMMPANELKQIREEIAAVRNLIQTAARPDFDSGPTIDQPASPAVGTLVVENRTSVGYAMNINGYDFVIMPGRREFPVEIGNIVTELRGFEAPRAWNAENFQDVNGRPQLAIQIH